MANWQCLYIFVLLCLWLAATIIGMTAGPNCDPDSDWWAGLAAAKTERHGKFNLADTCHIGVAAIYLSGINVVLLFLMLTVALLDGAEQYPAFQDISWRMRFKKSSLKPSTQEAEAEALLVYDA